MNRTLKEATVKRYRYESHDELRGLAPYEFICRAWTQEPERFSLGPSHHTPGLNT